MSDAQLQPFTLGAAVPRAHADVKALGGYDSAAYAARARTAAEAPLFGWMALRLEYEHGPGTGSDDRVTFGARAAILHQAAHGIDFGAGFFLQPRDFRGEGNILAGLLVGRRFGRLGVYANLFGGMDAEGDDGSAELRLSALFRATNALHLGFDGRGRYNFSDDEKRYDAQQIHWELQAGPTASLALGPLALVAIAGPSALASQNPGAGAREQTRVGLVALGGAGAIF